MNSECPSCGGCDAERAAENPAHTVNTGVRVFTSRIRNVLCRTCGLIFNDPMPTAQELGDLYRAMARDVSDRPNVAAVRIMPIEADQAGFVASGFSRKDAAVLDIGCSMGGFLAAMANRGARVVGIEPSPHDAAVARERFGIDVRGAFFEEVDFGAERFDIVSLRFVFEHVRDPRAVVRRARALVSDGGVLFIDVPNLATPFIGFDDFLSYGHLQTFTPDTLVSLCARERWKPLAIGQSANVFESSPHPPSIRALFSIDDRPGAPSIGESQVEGVRNHLRRYLTARQAFIDGARRRLLDAAATARRIVLYGAGTHTAELWSACPFLADRTIAMVDGNPRLQGYTFLDVPVHSPRELTKLEPDLVVISVRTAEPQIASFVEQQGLGGRMVRFYEQAGVVAA